MNYNQTLEYIHSISNFFCKPGLERIRELCEKIGNPQDSLRFVHVAGTNGKGSFCAMLSSVLKEAGYKTGLYTSPYILEFNERISINGEMISNEALCEITEYVKYAADSMSDKPTEFELITAIAFEYFKRQNCDIVVLECGLGGRYDATNIISYSLLSVITGISIDHTSFLGNTIKEIAGEKAGIIKNNGICLWCGNNSEAESVIKNEALHYNSAFKTADKNSLNIKEYSLRGTVFDYGKYKDLTINLLGVFQPLNAANVINAVEILSSLGYFISESALKSGLEKTIWKARFEIISKKPLIIADGGHNPEGVLAAVDSIKLYFKDKKVNVVTGVMKDKDYNFIAETISLVANKVFCITPDNPRALRASEFSKVFINLGTSAEGYNNTAVALRDAIKSSEEEGTPIICMGSLYMYKEIIDFLG